MPRSGRKWSWTDAGIISPPRSTAGACASISTAKRSARWCAPGSISAGGEAPGCIGSSEGGECFQGSLDDLRIYSEALSSGEIGRLYESGLDSLARGFKKAEARLAAVFVPGKTFAESLAGTRRNCAECRVLLDGDLAPAILARLKSTFPKEFENFMRWTGVSPLEYLLAEGNEYQLREVSRLVQMAAEYRPLTDQQKHRQTAADRRNWQELEAIERKLKDLKARGDLARFSPEWIEIILAVGPKIQIRPYQSEAVAPYVAPATPPTRNRTSVEACDVLRRDWLHQANEDPTPERIRREIGWTRQLAGRIRSEWCDASSRNSHSRTSCPNGTFPFGHAPDFSPELSAALAELEKLAATLSTRSEELYFKVRQIKRAIALGNPVVDFDKVLFVDMPYPQGSEWQHETRHRLGYMAVPGGRLLVLDWAFAGRQTVATHAAGAATRDVLAARSFLGCRKGPLLFQAAQREVVPLVRDPHRRNRTGAAHRRHLRRLRSDLSARWRAYPLLHHQGSHLRAVHAADQRLRAGPLRPRRQKHLPGFLQQRARLPALGDERRAGGLYAVGIHRQAALARRSSGP